MPDTTQYRCYLCGGESATVRQGYARDNEKLIPLECIRCGLVTLSSSAHITEDFYAAAHMHDNQPCDPELLLKQGREDDVRRFSQFQEKYITGRRVLDIGCGSGGFLLEARKAAHSVAGVEPERRLAPFFETRNLAVYPDIAGVPESLCPEVVAMFHVLEHIKDPLSMLQELRERFFPEGGMNNRLIIEVPSATDALLTIYNSEAFSRFTYWSCHLYLFTEDNLRELATRAGFSVVEMIQFQRYPLSNHMYWLAEGKPGGHVAWDFLNNEDLKVAYANTLKSKKACDTIIGVFS